MKIYNNVLDDNKFKELQTYIKGSNFPWYFNDTTCEKEEESIYQFTHTITKEQSIQNPHMLNLVKHILIDCLNFKEAHVIRSKFNLLPRQIYTEKDLQLTIHRDSKVDDKNIYSFIYYVNTSDGDTIFYDVNNTKVKPKENSGILFNSYTKHRATPPTINKARYVLNIVFAVTQY